MRKLYDQLYANGEYTKSFEEFQDQYGDTEKSKKLFDGLSKAGKYTKSFDTFNEQYEFKPVKTEAVATETASVTAVEKAVDTDLISKDGSSDFLKLSSALRGKTSRPDVFSEQVDLDEELFSRIGVTPEHLESLAVKREERKQQNIKLREDITEETKDIYNEFNNNLPLTDVNTIDYDDELSITEGRKKLQKKFVNNNEYIQKTIVPNAKKDIQPALDEYIISAKSKYDLNEPENIKQENVDAFYNDINSFYNKAINAKVSANTEFKNIVSTFDEVVDEKLGSGMKDFVKGKDSPNLYKAQQFLDNSPLGINRLGGEALEKLTTAWSSLRSVGNQIVKAGVYGGLAEVTDAVVSFEKNEEIAKNNNWSDDVVGYWQESDQASNPFRFVPKFNSDTGNNKGEGTTFKPGGSTEGTWGGFKKQFGEYVSAKDKNTSEQIIKIQSEDFITSNYDNDSFNKILEGEGVLDNVMSLGAEQLPQMALSLVTLGASSGLQIGGGIYTDGVENEARNRFKEDIDVFNKENNLREDNIPIQFLREVAKDQDFMKTLSAKAVSGGFVAGQLDKFGASKALSAFTIKSTQSLLRGGYKNFLKGVANGTLNNQKSAAIESITESLQEVIQAGSAGSEINMGDLAQASGTAYLTTSLFGVAGKIKSQSALETRTAAKIVAGKLNPNSSEAVFNTKIKEIEGIIKQESSTEVIKDLTEKRNSIIEVKNANKTLPDGYSAENKAKVLDLILKRDNISKEIEGKDPALVESQSQDIKDINSELGEIALVNLSEKAIEKGQKIASKVRKGVDKAAEQLNINLQRFNEKDGVSSKDQIEAKKQELLGDKYVLRNSVNYGQSFIDKEGNEVVLIDEELALKDNVYTTEQHEVLHPFLKQTFLNNKEASFSLGTSLLSELSNSKNVTIKNPEVQARVLQYLEEGFSASTTMEEVMNFTSEALSKGYIEINESTTTKIADLFRRFLRSVGVRVRFDKGSDVLNFIKDYNKTIESGKKLSRGMLRTKTEGAKGRITEQGIETLGKLDDGFGGVLKSAITKAVDNKQGDQNNVSSERSSMSLADLNNDLDSLNDREFEMDQGTFDSQKANLEFKIKQAEKKAIKAPIEVKNKKATTLKAIKEISTSNKKIASENESIVDTMNSLGANKVSDIKNPKDRAKIVRRITENNIGAVKKLAIAAANKDVPGVDANDKISYEEFYSGFSAELAALINTYESKVTKEGENLGKKVPFGAYMAPNLAIRYGQILDAAKKGKVDNSSSLSDERTSQLAGSVAVDSSSSRSNEDVKLIKATRILNPEQLTRAKKIVLDSKIDPKSLSYKKLKGLTSEITSEITGVDAKKINKPAKNLSKGETTSAAMFIIKNVDYIRNTLPEGAVLEGASEGLIGTATGVPKKMLAAFYVRGKRGDNLSPFILRKGLTSNEILEEVGRPKGGKPVPIDPRSPRGSVIKGIIDIVDRNITNELVRTEKYLLPIRDLTQQQKIDTGAGRGAAVFSLKQSSELMSKIQELSQLRDIKSVAKNLGHPYNSPKENNRKRLQADVLSSIKEFGLDSNTFLAMSPASGGAVNQRRSNGDVYYKLDNGEWMKGIYTGKTNIVGKKMFNQPVAPKGTSLLAPTGRLYYGTTDDAYITALAASRLNDNKRTFSKAVKLGMPSKDAAIDSKWIKDREEKSKNNMNVLDSVVSQLAKAVNPTDNKPAMSMDIAVLIIAQGYQATSGLIKIAAPFKYASVNFEHGEGKNSLGKKYREEHNPPASVVGASILAAIKSNAVVPVMKAIRSNYHQTQLSKKDDSKLDAAKLDATMPEGTTIFDNPIIRLVKAGIDLNSIIDPVTGKTLAEINNVGIPSNVYSSFNNTEKLIISDYQNKILEEYLSDNSVKSAALIKNYLKLVPSKAKASNSNNEQALSSIRYSKPISIQAGIDMLAKTDKALDNARKLDAPVKKIRVFDFDDTLAQTNSNVLYTMPDGTEGKINAATFAKEAGNMEAEGAVWDFSEFSKVVDGKKGPLFEVAKIIADKRGTDDVFVLTARPANAAGPIKEFLASIGLNIPLKNITGLGDGAPQAKAGWIMGKAAEGYNDFYFADDHTGNTKAVKNVLSVLDVKSKVQLAIVKNSLVLDSEFNKILEIKTGIAAEKNYAKVKAALVGQKKGRFNFFIPPAAEDFVGLLYSTLGKGKTGDAQMKWYKEHLLDPYARAIENITRDRNTLGRNFKALKKELKVVPKDLKKKIPGEVFTKEQAVRVYIWDQTGKDIPGLSKSDLKELVDMVKSDANLELFAQEVMKLNKGRAYVSPTASWTTGTITTDLIEALNTTGRKQYLELWQQNVDTIFSEKNLNKLEAAYGKSYRVAMENILKRMKTGRNRTFGGDTTTGRFTDWINGSTAAIMFFNTRSAALQTLSAVNFINFGDNNVFAAGKAFANQPQFWSDFSKLWNSDFLIERRDGLKININESDIADVAKENGIRGVIGKLLKLGFTPTQLADSFAIASGGSTFYRNRVKSLIKGGMDSTAAEKQAMRDFREVAEESQQSSRPDKISSQQAGPLGRIILAFANTPAQYARLMKKAASDLKNGRGDAKTNISKIMYYGVAQNLIFNALQQALFAVAFGDEDEDDSVLEEKSVKILNGMVDSIARGTGLYGAIFTVVKNTGIKLWEATEKNNPKYEDVALDLLKISPPISSKVQKLRSAGRTASWNMKDIKSKGFGLDNPAYLATGNVVSAATNIPLDRAIKKLNNLKAASDANIEAYKRIALIAGWSEWELGIDSKEKKKINKPTVTRKVRTRRTRTRRE